MYSPTVGSDFINVSFRKVDRSMINCYKPLKLLWYRGECRYFDQYLKKDTMKLNGGHCYHKRTLWAIY